MISKETAEKILKTAGKTRVMIITENYQETWDIKWKLQDCALVIDPEAEITSLGVAVKGYKPITVLDHVSVNRDKWVLGGAVLVTHKDVVGHLKTSPENPVKILLLPTEGVSK